MSGLRTLVMTRKVLARDFFEKWSRFHFEKKDSLRAWKNNNLMKSVEE
jgi:hypothetical protein